MYSFIKKSIHYLGILAILFSIIAVIWMLRAGILNDQNQFKDFVMKYDVFAPIVFIAIQILQIIFPIIPGGITTIVGFLIFGTLKGFIYNYIGIMLGSILLFLLVKKYGRPFILLFISEVDFFKYEKKLESKTYERFFILCMASPVSPADIIVMITGLSNMSLTRFTTILLITKPLSIISYSYFWIFGGKYIKDFIN